MLTIATAKAYVRDYFAKADWDEPQTCDILDAEASTDCEDAIDVYFRLNDIEQPYRFTIWIERYPNVAPYIYGEW